MSARYPHGGAVVARDERRIGEDGLAALHVHEPRGPVEIEVELLLVEQVEHRHVVLAETQVLDGGLQFLRRHEEIGEDDDQRALADCLGGIVQGLEERRAAARADARRAGP